MVLEYITPALQGVTPCMGPWDEGPEEASVEFLSINLDGGLRPGVISRTRYVEFWYASKRDQASMDGGKSAAMAVADRISQYIHDNPSSSCFANIIPITDIIGPKVTEHQRLAFNFTIEFTN